MLKTLRNRPETVFVLVLLWKAALLVFTAQPIPANDSFFYDGAVVNLLSGGKYCNPAIANALPISGTEVFSAYPPLYQLALLGWMRVAGTSVISAMWLHFLLFAGYALFVLATLRELRVPVWCAHFAGLFLLGITFHDRPDSLAQVFGLAAVYAAVRAFRPRPSSSSSISGITSSTRTKEEDEDDPQSQGPAKPWLWLAATSVILCLCTSLQIGGIYFLLLWLALLLPTWLSGKVGGRARLSQRAAVEVPRDGALDTYSRKSVHSAPIFCVTPCAPFEFGFDSFGSGSAGLGQTRPTSLAWFKVPPAWPALLVMTLVPVALVFGVKWLWPQLWAGFQEHAQQTPTLTSWRWPEFVELLKIIRSAPGVLLVLGLLPFNALPAACRQVWHQPADVTSAARSSGGQQMLDARQLAVLISVGAATIVVLAAALCFLAANLVLIAAYLQPLLVGVFLGLWAGVEKSQSRLTALKVVLSLAVLLASIRALGLTTVGVACAADVSEGEARRRIAEELAAAPEKSTAALSAAYLYDAWPEAHRLKLLHADWLGPAVKDQSNAEVDALRAVKPTRLILTQFDYYRRYVRVLAQLHSTTSAVSVRVENLAHVRPPDASSRWQRVVQHVSWAPVIVTLDWAERER